MGLLLRRARNLVFLSLCDNAKGAVGPKRIRMPADYHTHTPLCHHAEGTPEEYIDAALAAARALYDTKAKPQEIAEKAMKIAADICVYTNHNLVVETLDEAE